MRPQELEPEIDAFLQRLVPGLSDQWRGASPEQIDRIETLMGRTLPRFYRWFLMRMGASMGPVQYRSLDFSADRILSPDAAGLVSGFGPRFFMIGYETDEVMPLHLFYDFDNQARDDARVSSIHSMGGPTHPQFDTFREMIAWGELCSWIKSRPQTCAGSFDGHGDDVFAQLDSALMSFGFTKPIATGSNCGLYEYRDAAVSVSATPGDPPGRYHFFHFGASNTGLVRRLLGVIANETSLEVKIKEWMPSLPDAVGLP